MAATERSLKVKRNFNLMNDRGPLRYHAYKNGMMRNSL